MENTQTKIFVRQLEVLDLVKTEDIASLENQPTPEDVFDTLILQGASEVKLTEAYARFRAVPFVHLHEISSGARGVLDESLMRKFGFIPFYLDEGSKIIQVAITDPRKLIHLDHRRLDKLSSRLGYKIEVVMAAKGQAEAALAAPILSEPEPPKSAEVEESKQPEPMQDKVEKNTHERSYTNPVDLELIKNLANRSDHSSLTLAVLKYGLDKKASEIIIEPFEKRLVVRLKLDGVSHNLITLPITLLSGIVSQLTELGDLAQESPTAGTISINLGKELASEISVSILPTIFGERIYMKYLRSSSELPTLDKLGLFEKSRDKIELALSAGYGLILIGGRSDAGKTTTMYAISEYLASKGKDVITIESSVSYRFNEITQVQTNPELGLDNLSCLRAALTQSPDVIVIDSIADSKTAKLALEAALSGKLILAGVYSKTASQALMQFNALSNEPYLLSSALRLVIAQSLVRKICGSCRVEVRVSEAVEAKVKSELNTSQNLRFYKGGSCPGCKNGFRGRIGVFEILTPSDDVIEALDSGADAVFHQARRSGMISMRQDGLLKVVSGLTTIDEVIKNTKAEG